MNQDNNQNFPQDNSMGGTLGNPAAPLDSNLPTQNPIEESINVPIPQPSMIPAANGVEEVPVITRPEDVLGTTTPEFTTST
jgi:hypothetical protein